MLIITYITIIPFFLPLTLAKVANTHMKCRNSGFIVQFGLNKLAILVLNAENLQNLLLYIPMLYPCKSYIGIYANNIADILYGMEDKAF